MIDKKFRPVTINPTIDALQVKFISGMSRVVTLEPSVQCLTSETGISGNPPIQSLELEWLAEINKDQYTYNGV